jgi:hypothetical protein
MNTEKVIKNWKTIMLSNLIVGLMLLITGILFNMYDYTFSASLILYTFLTHFCPFSL